MKGGAGVGLPSLNGIWTWLAIVVIIWTSEIDFRKSQQRRRAPLWRCAYLFSKETNPKKKKKKKNIFQFQICVSRCRLFSPLRNKKKKKTTTTTRRKKTRALFVQNAFGPFVARSQQQHVFQRARAILCCVFVLCVDTVKSDEENFETVVLFSLVFF